jgi:hypothetical protein
MLVDTRLDSTFTQSVLYSTIFPTGIYQRIESLDSFMTLTGVDMFQELSLI